MFFGPVGKTRWPPWSLIDLRHFRLLFWNRSTEFNETWLEAWSQCLLQSLCFTSCSEKQDGCPGLWLAETFSISPLEPLNRIQRNLTGSKVWTSSTKFVFFGLIQKNKMAALASDWLRHFRLLLWNHWMEFNETWQEARSQRSLPSLCFSGRSEKQDGRLSLWLAETFSTSLKPLNGLLRNLTGRKISTSNVLYQVCVFWADREKKQDGRPCQSVKKVAHCTQVHDMWPFWASCLKFNRTVKRILYSSQDRALALCMIWLVSFVWAVDMWRTRSKREKKEKFFPTMGIQMNPKPLKDLESDALGTWRIIQHEEGKKLW